MQCECVFCSVGRAQFKTDQVWLSWPGPPYVLCLLCPHPPFHAGRGKSGNTKLYEGLKRKNYRIGYKSRNNEKRGSSDLDFIFVVHHPNQTQQSLSPPLTTSPFWQFYRELCCRLDGGSSLETLDPHGVEAAAVPRPSSPDYFGSEIQVVYCDVEPSALLLSLSFCFHCSSRTNFNNRSGITLHLC